MGEEITNLPSLKFPVLPLTTGTTTDSPEHPLQTRASVPFKWEEQPGKPRPCTDIIVRPEPVGLVLELPPCRKLQQHCSSGSTTLLLDPYAEDKMAKTPSPTAVLDGPYNVGRPKFSSFRLFVTESVHDAVLDGSLTGESPREEEGVVGKMKTKKKRRKGFFGKFSRGGKEAALGGGGFSSSSRFSPFSTTTSCESDHESTAKSLFDGKMKRNGSFSDGLSSHGGVRNEPSSSSSSSSSSSRFLASIYEGLKQVIHWNSNSRKSSKEIHI